MLQAPLLLTTAKLDISLLLKASPPPSPVPSPPTAAGGSAGGPSTRSASVPPPSTSNLLSASSNRTSTSSVVSGAASRVGPSSNASLPSISEQSRASQPSQSPRQGRAQPAAPPILHPLNPAAPIPPYLPAPRNIQPHTSASLLPSPSFQPGSKRPPPSSPHPAASPAKRQSKWTPEEDALIIELRGSGMKWEDISKRLPGRSAISCRLHYQNYLERRSEWDEERKNRLARLYERLKPEMWAPVALELGIPWRAAEAMHWQLGEADMARRAGVVPFSLAATSSAPGIPLAGLAANHLSPSAPSANQYFPSAIGPAPNMLSSVGLGLGNPAAPNESYGARPGRPDGAPPKREHDFPVPPPVSLMPASSNQPPSILPSMAELERGLTAPDAAQRTYERQQ